MLKIRSSTRLTSIIRALEKQKDAGEALNSRPAWGTQQTSASKQNLV